MSNPFFDRPILNSPYAIPTRHWELDEHGQPTQKILETRRRAEFITPIPKPKKRKRAVAQEEIVFDEGKGLSTKAQQYDTTSLINEVRQQVEHWRGLANPALWQVTPETARLLQHWRLHKFSSIRPFFCQVEAAETAIWLVEVAPHSARGKNILDTLASASRDANPALMRLALKLATGAGKTTVMAMLIAWQTINAVRRSGSKHFTRGFLVCTPGLTIKDRLRVLQPNDPDSYYKDRELVPSDMLNEVNKAKIVITNYHAFKLRERVELSAGGRALLKGRGGDELATLETEGQMLQRVMPDLMGMKHILVINDEAPRTLRLMREAGLLAPARAQRTLGPRVHDGTITPELPNVMWGADATGVWTEREGMVTVFAAIDHATAECVGIHAAKFATRFEALEPIRQGVRRIFGHYAPGVANGLLLRHDHGSQFVSRVFQNELAFLGIDSSPAFVRAPEGNGCIERFFRTLKEQLLWIRSFVDAEDVRRAVTDWIALYNENWLIERHGHRSPAAVRRELLAVRVPA